MVIPTLSRCPEFDFQGHPVRKLGRSFRSGSHSAHGAIDQEMRSSSALRASVIRRNCSWLPPTSGCAFWASRR